MRLVIEAGSLLLNVTAIGIVVRAFVRIARRDG
jgi:hypothetical protein